MNKFEKKVTLYTKTLTDKMNHKKVDMGLLEAITTYLGPSIYDKDASKVACSQKVERDAIRDNFLIKKLGLAPDPALDQAIKHVCLEMGSANRNKYRAVFYYLLVIEFGLQSRFSGDPSAAPLFGSSTSKEKKMGAKNLSDAIDIPVPAATGDPQKRRSEASPLTPPINKASEHQEPKLKSKEDTKSQETSDKGDDTPTEKNNKPRFRSIGSSEAIINKYAWGAAVGGIVPIPLIDLATITSVQYQMIKALANNYPHVNFDGSRTKSAIAAIMGGLGSFEVGIAARILLKGIPLVGPIIGGTAMSGMAFTSTRLIGRIFDEHFATGNDLTLESVTLQDMKEAFNWEIGNR